MANFFILFSSNPPNLEYALIAVPEAWCGITKSISETPKLFFDKILKVINNVNEKHYKFELSNPITLEAVQFTKYHSGGFYSQHTDWEGGGILDIRKLSWVINLSNPMDYRGGDLQVLEERVPKNMGWIHLFPSFLRHQATKVFKGTRYSLVGWTIGPPFK